MRYDPRYESGVSDPEVDQIISEHLEKCDGNCGPYRDNEGSRAFPMPCGFWPFN